MVNYYFDLVLSGNYESASGLWEPSSLARANRLGIEYDNMGIKIDCSSPIIYDFDRMRNYIAQGVHSVAVIDSQVIRWKFRAEKQDKKGEKSSHFYYTTKAGGIGLGLSTAKTARDEDRSANRQKISATNKSQ